MLCFFVLFLQGLWDQDKETEWKAQLHKEITGAAAEAEKIALPSVDSLFEDVYEEIPLHLQKQVRYVFQLAVVLVPVVRRGL